MFQNKRKKTAFTLAELMVIMSVMTVILAAVAPIFTSRLANASFDSVWSTVGASNMNDIYSDASIRSMMQETLIGITPINMDDMRKTYQPYSKLIIRSSNKIGGSKAQKQIEFKYDGTSDGFLFGSNANLLLGGFYNDINITYSTPDINHIMESVISEGASYNTAIGRNALNSLSTGKYNTAFGYNALNSVTTGNANTAIGYSAGSSLTTGSGNVFVGYNSYNAQTGDYNTVIGTNTSSHSSASSYTTAIGNNVNVKGNYNVAVGDNSNAGGTYNTALGYNALTSANTASDSYSSFKYNTAIGYNSCSGISSNAQNTTCIGGAGVNNSTMSSTAVSLFNDSHSRVLIGRGTSKYNSAATLEVYNLNSTNSRYPYPANISGAPVLGDSAVVVNGNLIVRGQTYMIGQSPFPMSPTSSTFNPAKTISLMGYRLYKDSQSDHKPLIGIDGSEITQRIYQQNSDGMHELYNGREHCICNYSCSVSTKDYNGGFSGRDSYDWSTVKYVKTSSPAPMINIFGGTSYFFGTTPHSCGNSYVSESSVADNVELNGAKNLMSGGSCCPILTSNGVALDKSVSSDLRLKNIESSYNTGLANILKLKIYNYVYKSDAKKLPHVGVMAQDLKRYFPDSVSKDKNGYYQINTEELFYAAINSVKELHSNIVALITKANNCITRLTSLKKENDKLKNKLLILSKELEEIEK